MIFLQCLRDVVTKKGFNTETQILTKDGIYVATGLQKSLWGTHYHVYPDIPGVEPIRINAKFFRQLDEMVLVDVDYNQAMYGFLQENDADFTCHVYKVLKSFDISRESIKTLTVEIVRLLIFSDRRHDIEHVLQTLTRVFQNLFNDSSYNEQYLERLANAIHLLGSKR